MSDVRRDTVSGHLVIMAPGRGARPHSATVRVPADEPPRRALPADCPFCPGHESMTPPEICRTGPGEPGTPGWRVRVVPNKYPITDAHEVVVLSPAHDAAFADLTDEHAAEVLAVLRDRVVAQHAAGKQFAQALLNEGREAGASLAHPHAQVVALDSLPPAVAESVDRFDAAGTDLVAAQAAEAAGDARAVVDGPAPSWCPWASMTPFQLRVAHRSTRARFDEATDDEIGAVATSLRDGLARLRLAAGDVAYNVVVHSAPPRVAAGSFHWYIDVLPRASVVAGFEEGTGIFVNTVAPQHAAAQLRGVG